VFCRANEPNQQPGVAKPAWGFGAEAARALELGVNGFWLPVRAETGSGQPLLEPFAAWLLKADTPLGYAFWWDTREAEPLSPLQEQHLLEALLNWMGLPRQLHWDGKAVLVIEGSEQMSNPAFTLRRWRLAAARRGVELCLLAGRCEAVPEGFDGAIEDAERIPCRQVSGGRLYGSLLYHAHHYRSRTDRWVPTVLSGEPAGDHRAGTWPWVGAKAETYREWLEQARAFSAFTTGPEAMVYVDGWSGHRQWAQPVAGKQSTLPVAWPAPVQREGGSVDSRRIAVAIHAFYPDNLATMLHSLAHAVSFPVDLYVSTPADQIGAIEALIRKHGAWAYRIFGVENRGRDMLPFVAALLPALVANGHGMFVKLHTKRSPHLEQGRTWSEHLIGSLLVAMGSGELERRLAADPSLGLLAAAGALTPCTVCLHQNGPWLLTLIGKLGVPGKRFVGMRFVAGSMVGGRVAAVLPLLELGVSPESYEAETGQRDGTLAHAMERMLGAAAEVQGFRLEELPGDRFGAVQFGCEWARP
jgi:hypothetical protein